MARNSQDTMHDQSDMGYSKVAVMPAEPFMGRQRISVVGVPIDVLTMQQAVSHISEWARQSESRFVCICNAHSVVTANEDHAFRSAIDDADMATPDGAPVAWMLRWLGADQETRVSGPDLMLEYLELAQLRGEAVGLYGSSPETLAALQVRLLAQWPTLKICYAFSPPFRKLTPEEDEAIVTSINQSGARTLWVSLGCPKQELWMAAHMNRVRSVMIGVGAAFDFHAGSVARAPLWMRNSGLEWLHRLYSEPRRLFRRYLSTNTKFIIGAIRQLMLRG